ncbi:potassium channel family protein [Vibrio hepatarius]|jgi:voltage-gated potassium channel|uniref:Capsular biosynthesis protein n=1 Tax=Vibrio hepatarius TaxID=171383 RepID=A0A0M0I1P8_9VIBR|nr:potassium channel family protein [Vibrio hepatarius]KOO07838.1 capsular biosynthesis protein [Vibrio hepatarius]
MKKDDTKDDTKPMSVLSLILSFMALFVISGLLFFPLRPETRQVFIGLDFIICSIFILQLGIDLIRSGDRVQFLKVHWIDFIASIPMIEPLRYARLVQILRVVFGIHSSRNLYRQFLNNRREATFASIIFLLVMLLFLGSSMMLFIESKSPDANIQNGADALWWALVTISTVGYGDHYPVTDAGKILAAALIVCGVGVFGMISGLVTSFLTSPTSKQNERSERKEHMIRELLDKQDLILQRLDELEKRSEPTNKQ